MVAPASGSEPVASDLPEFRHSILSANALTLDDVQDTDKKIDEEIK
jgi:vacuolar-type H+-ATPase subunit F/Vma7